MFLENCSLHDNFASFVLAGGGCLHNEQLEVRTLFGLGILLSTVATETIRQGLPVVTLFTEKVSAAECLDWFTDDIETYGATLVYQRLDELLLSFHILLYTDRAMEM